MGLLANIYFRLLDWYTLSLRKELKDCYSVLDLGCGEDSPLSHCPATFSLGVDSFLPYLQASRRKGIHSSYLQADIRSVAFATRTFDAVVALDVLEHLTREEGLALLQRMESWAKRKVIVFTPQGYLVQEAYDDNPHQAHHSGWQVADFLTRGYQVRGMRGWHALRTERAQLRFRPRFLWSILSGLTQPLAYWKPSLAFQLLCVKQVKEGAGRLA